MKTNNACGISRSLVFWSMGGLTCLVIGLLTLDKIYYQQESTDEKVTNITETSFIKSDTVTEVPPAQDFSYNTPEIENGEITPKEQMISQLVSSGRPIHDIAEDLLRLLPETEGSEQIIVASHLSNLADGEQINQLVTFLSSPSINDEAKEEIFNSIYDTEPKQVATLLIQVIEDGVKDYTDEAQEGLSILLQADHGVDVAAWKSELSKTENFLDAE